MSAPPPVPEDSPANNDPNVRVPILLSRSVGSRRAFLCGILLAEMAITLFFLRRDPMASRFLIGLGKRSTHIEEAIDISEITKDDPALGLPLPPIGAGPSLRSSRFKSEVGYILVPVGDCATCFSADLRSWERQAKALGIPFVLLTSASEKDARRFMKELRLSSSFVCDKEYALANRLNAAWAARPYFFDAQWRLKWLAKTSGRDYDPFKDTTFQSALQESRQ